MQVILSKSKCNKLIYENVRRVERLPDSILLLRMENNRTMRYDLTIWRYIVR